MTKYKVSRYRAVKKYQQKLKEEGKKRSSLRWDDSIKEKIKSAAFANGISTQDFLFHIDVDNIKINV